MTKFTNGTNARTGPNTHNCCIRSSQTVFLLLGLIPTLFEADVAPQKQTDKPQVEVVRTEQISANSAIF